MARKPADPAELLPAALEATRPSSWIAFADGFAPTIDGWSALVRDLVALANSGGGVLLVGVNRSGTPTGWDATEFLALDRATVAEKLREFTGERVDNFEITPATKNGGTFGAVVVGPRTRAPLIFERDGDGFVHGSVYFRHGGKSEPGNARDLARFATHETSRLRRELARNLRKVAYAPPGAEVIVSSPAAGPAATVERFRIVDDPEALAVARTDFDVTHPYRQKELINTINDRAGRKVVGPYEILCVRRVYDIDNRPEFAHMPKFGTRQYSDAFVSWLITEYQRDPQFFEHAKHTYRPPRDEEASAGDA